MINNFYDKFNEDVKNIIKPFYIADFVLIPFNAQIYILSKNQIEMANDASGDYRKVIKYIMPGTWVRTQNGKSAIYQFKDIFKEKPRFVSIKYWETGFVQPVFSVEGVAKVQLSDKVIPDKLVWVFVCDAP